MREPSRDPNPREIPYESGQEPLRYSRPGPLREVLPSSPRGLVEWSSAWGGVFVSLGVLILFSALGYAIGLGNGAVWGGICVIIGFFAGGLFTGRTLDMVDSPVAAAHGALVWAVSLIFTLVFAILTTFMGINALANVGRTAILSNLAGITSFGVGAAVGPAQAAANATTSSWVGFVVLILALAAAVAGSMIGNGGRNSETVVR